MKKALEVKENSEAVRRIMSYMVKKGDECKVKVKKRKIAWGITGAGDKIAEIVEMMKDLKTQSEEKVEIEFTFPKR